MTGDHPPPDHWVLIEDGELLRFGRSLANLAGSDASTGRPHLRALIESLQLIRPLDERHDHAWVHLHHCAQQARRIVQHPAFGIAADDGAILMAVYEAALIAAADRQSFRVDDQPLGRFTRWDLESVARVGLRHGDTIQHWWSSYAAAIEALFGATRS